MTNTGMKVTNPGLVSGNGQGGKIKCFQPRVVDVVIVLNGGLPCLLQRHSQYNVISKL